MANIIFSPHVRHGTDAKDDLVSRGHPNRYYGSSMNGVSERAKFISPSLLFRPYIMAYDSWILTYKLLPAVKKRTEINQGGKSNTGHGVA